MNGGRVVKKVRRDKFTSSPPTSLSPPLWVNQSLFRKSIANAGAFHGVQTDDHLIIHAASPASAYTATAGDKVLLSVRPEAMELKAACSTPTGLNHLTGHVTASAYQGSFVEYEIQLAERTIKTYAVNPKGNALFQPGQEVAVTLQPTMLSLCAVTEERAIALHSKPREFDLRDQT